jgi:hypothetical protein
MYNNTTSLHPTYFLRGSDLVINATETYRAASENWPYPTQFRYGIPIDDYYAEVWVNGMDYQNNYWVLEEINCEDPICQPLIIFEHSDEEDRFNGHDFSTLVKGALYFRRDIVFVQHDDFGWYEELLWPYLERVGDEERFEVMYEFEFKHNSQKAVRFWMNANFIPHHVMERGINEKNRSDRNQKKKFRRSVEKGGAEIIRIV